MLEASKHRLAERLGPDDVVLDIGGWADPFHRADWVMDVMPFDTRGLYEREGWIDEGDRAHRRFDEKTWIQRDICDRTPYPFADKEIDFVICSHTLEDVRDPVWVCSEMARIAKAGYIETPSMLEELSYGFRGPLVGWEHHRWLIEVDQDEARIEFMFKDHTLHSRPELHFPAGFRDLLGEEQRVATLWWEGDFSYRERVFVGEGPEEHLKDFVLRESGRRGPRPGRFRRLLRR
jgi:hypothetical protein